jgi:hypothetical protein
VGWRREDEGLDKRRSRVLVERRELDVDYDIDVAVESG